MNKTTKLLITVSVLILLGGVIFLATQKTPIYAPSQTVTVPEVKDSSDLKAVEANLDNENLDNIDSELNQLDSDSSTF